MIHQVFPPATHICTNTECSAREWNVAEADQRELWYLRGFKGGFSVSSVKPVCPICGASLLEIASLEPGLQTITSS